MTAWKEESRSAPIFGIDLSPRMIGLARHAYPHLRFTEGSMTALGLPEECLAELLGAAGFTITTRLLQEPGESSKRRQGCFLATKPVP